MEEEDRQTLSCLLLWYNVYWGLSLGWIVSLFTTCGTLDQKAYVEHQLRLQNCTWPPPPNDCDPFCAAARRQAIWEASDQALRLCFYYCPWGLLWGVVATLGCLGGGGVWYYRLQWSRGCRTLREWLRVGGRWLQDRWVVLRSMYRQFNSKRVSNSVALAVPQPSSPLPEFPRPDSPLSPLPPYLFDRPYWPLMDRPSSPPPLITLPPPSLPPLLLPPLPHPGHGVSPLELVSPLSPLCPLSDLATLKPERV